MSGSKEDPIQAFDLWTNASFFFFLQENKKNKYHIVFLKTVENESNK